MSFRRSSLALLMSLGTWIYSPAHASVCVDHRDFMHPIGHLELQARVLALQGNTLCALESGKIHIIDVSQPSAPVSIATLPSPGGSLKDLVLSGTHLYLAMSDGLAVVDLSDPSSPEILQLQPLTSMPLRLAARDTTLFVLRTDRFEVFDASSPDTLISIAEIPGPGVLPGTLSIDGDLALVGLSTGILWQHIQLIDISDPAHPTALSAFDESFYDQGYLNNGTASLYGFTGFRTYDVTQPGSPLLLSEVERFARYTPDRLRGDGDLLFLPDNYFTTHVLDIRDPASPDSLAPFHGAFDVAFDSTYLYTLTWEGLIAYDRRGLPSPSVLSIVDDADTYHDVVRAGDLLYAATSEGLSCIDVSAPVAPVTLATLAIPAEALTLGGGFAWVASDSTVRVVDVTVPEHPQTVFTWIATGVVRDLEWVGQRLLIASPDPVRLVTYDVSTPTAPRLIASVGTDSWDQSASLSQLEVNDRYACLVAHVVEIFDISDIDAPTYQGYFHNPDGAYGLSMDSEYAFGADRSHGWIFSFALDPLDRRSRILRFPAPGETDRSGPYLYVSSAEGFVQIFDVSEDPLQPRAVRMIWLGDASAFHQVTVAGDLVLTYGNRLHLSAAECTVSTPVLLTDLRAEPTTAGIQLRWRVLDGAFVAFRVQRAPGEAPDPEEFETLEAASAVPGGPPWEFLDRTAQPGETYSYRVLGILDDGNAMVAGPVVTTATLVDLALQAVLPNPVHTSATLSFTLPNSMSLRLEIFDTAGRRVREVASGRWPAGRHVVQWTGIDQRGVAVANGVYHVRLTAHGRQQSVSLVLLR